MKPIARAFTAFISYSSEDQVVGSWIHEKLERYSIPAPLRSQSGGSANLGRFFRDREELAVGKQLSEEIRAALQNSKRLIVLCSDAAARSQWVEREVQTFQGLGRGQQILPVIVEGSLPSCLPPSLKDTDLLAADLRPEADGREIGLLKIVAWILDLPFTVVRDREFLAERARRRRLVGLAVTFGVLCLAAISGLVGTVVYSRRSSQLAVAAIDSSGEISDTAMTALLNSDASEKAVQVLLGKAKDDLEGLYSHGVQLPALRRRHAWTLVRFAQLFLMRKDWKEAERNASEALGLIAESRDYSARLTAVTAQIALPNAHELAGDHARAVQVAREGLLGAKALAEEFGSEHRQARLCRAEAGAALGDALDAVGDAQGALRVYEEAIGHISELVKEVPDDEVYPMIASRNYEAAADLQEKLGKPAPAAEYCLEAARLFLKFLRWNKGRIDLHHDALVLALKAGEAQLRMGGRAGALEALKLGEQSLSWLLEKDPENEEARHNMNRAQAMILQVQDGQNPFEGGATEDAHIYHDTADRTPESFAREGALLSRAQAAYKRGDLSAEAGNMEGADQDYATALELLGRIRGHGGWTLDSESLYAEVLLSRGALAVDLKDLPKAKRLLIEARDRYDGLIRRDQGNEKWQRGASMARGVLAGVE
jgi:tetratricopeptide (TPR) repeat protein